MSESERTAAADARDLQADERAGQADARQHSSLGALVWLFGVVCVIGAVMILVILSFNQRLDDAKHDRDVARYEFVQFERDMAHIHCMNLPPEARARQVECDPDHYPLPLKPKGAK